jgi:hypothetical protein
MIGRDVSQLSSLFLCLQRGFVSLVALQPVAGHPRNSWKISVIRNQEPFAFERNWSYEGVWAFCIV